MRFLKNFCLLMLAAACGLASAAYGARPCFAAGESYTFFCGDSSADCREVTVKRGAAIAKLLLCDVCGESTSYDYIDIAALLREVNGRVIFTEELCDSVNYYCSADLPYSVTLYGEEINLHICVRESGTAVGSPIIFGGY